MSRTATRRLIRTLRDLDIPCALAECDSVYYATRVDAARRLRVEYQRRAAYIGAHAEYPRHLFALGYGGNGMMFGFLAARLLLDWYRGGRSSEHRLFTFDR